MAVLLRLPRPLLLRLANRQAVVAGVMALRKRLRLLKQRLRPRQWAAAFLAVPSRRRRGWLVA